MTTPDGAPVRGAWPTNRILVAILAAVLVPVQLVAGCGGGSGGGSGGGTEGADRALVIGAIPDQDTDKLQEIYGATARYLSAKLGMPVEFRPVTDYAAAVNQFRTGRLDLVWFGGLTGVQARQQTPGAVALVQRDIDDDFHSVFIAGTGTGLRPFTDAAGLKGLAGRTFTFGSQSSTSGYLMPAYFLLQAGVDPERDFSGRPGFSGSHDKTIDLVESGSYAAGAVNQQVWQSRLDARRVDTGRIAVLWRTPAYADYHWVLGPSALRDFGADVDERITEAFVDLSPGDPADAALLKLFGAEAFVPTDAGNYRHIEEVGRRLGLLQGQ
jgi:phosphonate transport system substrate-binding protein